MTTPPPMIDPNYVTSIGDLLAKTGKTVPEFLAMMRQSGFGIRFDVSQIPPEWRDHPVLTKFELILTITYADEMERTAVCLHEAAHAEYSELDGASYVEFLPPRAYMEDGRPIFNYAAVSGFHHPDHLSYAKCLLAGKIVQQSLINIPTANNYKNSDDGDKEMLKEYFDEHGVDERERERICQQARTEVLKDLRKPAFRNRLWGTR